MNRGPAAFCRWCGTPLGLPTDPVLGTTTRRAMRSGSGLTMGTVLGAVALILLVAVTGWLVLGGGLVHLIPAANATPTPSGGASASPSASASSLPSASPTVTPTPTSGGPSASPSPSPSPSTSAEPTAPPTSTGFTCDPATIGDPNSAVWQVTNYQWSQHSGYDEMELDLTLRRTSATNAATATVESMTSSDVADRFGMTAPTTSRAIVVTFQGPVTVTFDTSHETGYSVIAEVAVGTGNDGLVHAVIGAQGNGCYKLSAADWGQSSAPATARVLVDVRPH